MNRQKMIRQGDVLLVPIEAIPSGAVPVGPDGERVVLAYGEVTGHAHALPAVTVSMWSAGEQRYVRVAQTSTLVHEEHAHHDVAVGDYAVIQQREYTPEAIRNVAD
jgi:hypothetical protein